MWHGSIGLNLLVFRTSKPEQFRKTKCDRKLQAMITKAHLSGA